MIAGSPCTKYLIVAHAKLKKTIAFNMVSNSVLTEVEFRTWRDRMEKRLENIKNRTWRDRMEKRMEKIKVPRQKKIKHIGALMESIESIKNYKCSQKELNEIINRKREIKIRNKDKSINITHELSFYTQEMNYAYQKYIETKKISYAKRIRELRPLIQNLTEMAKERERENLEKVEADRIDSINKINVQNQKMEEIENSMLHKKKKKELNTSNPYNRRDCNPINLFDSGYLNMNIIKAEAIEEDDILVEEMNENKNN